MSEDDAKAAAMLKKIMKGKGKASGDDDENDEDLDEDDDLEMEEIIVCTLDPEKVRATFLRVQSAFRKYLHNLPRLN